MIQRSHSSRSEQFSKSKTHCLNDIQRIRKKIYNGHFLLKQGNIFFFVQFNISYLPIFTIHLLAVFTTTLFLQKVYCACIIGAYDNAYDSLSTRKSCWNLNLLRTRQQCSFLAIKSTKKKSYNWVVQSHNGLLFFLNFTFKRSYSLVIYFGHSVKSIRVTNLQAKNTLLCKLF